MVKSMFEDMNNSRLFFMLKLISKDHGYASFDFNDIQESSFKDSCDNAGVMLGISKRNMKYIDYNYLLSVLLLNKGFDFTNKTPSGILTRPPSVSLYQFHVDEHRMEYVVRTYSHEVESYLPEIIEPMVRGMEDDAEFDYYSGKEINVEYLDGETNDVVFFWDDLKKIK